MKIAYLGKIQLSDVDLSYLHEAQELSDITYIMEVNPRFLTGPAFNIKAIHPKSGLFKTVDIYPDVKRLQGFIDLDKFYVLNTCGRWWVAKSFWTHCLLLLFLIRNRYDIIHLVWPPNIYEFILYFLKRKMMLTVHDPFPHTGLDTFIVRLRRKFAFRFIPRLVILNKAQRQQFLNYYQLQPDRIIDSQLSRYTYLQTVVPDASATRPKNSYILFVGKISPYKGLNYLLPAMVKAHEQCPESRLIVAGGGAFHFDVTPYNSLSYVELRNRFIPEEELVALISNAAFVVCPYTDATQSGVIMSAFAFNKPVIATNVGGLPEMVRHQHYGLIVKEKDVEALAEGIVTLWKRQDIIQKYAGNIRRDYSTGEQSWKNVAEKLLAEYSKAQ